MGFYVALKIISLIYGDGTSRGNPSGVKANLSDLAGTLPSKGDTISIAPDS